MPRPDAATALRPTIYITGADLRRLSELVGSSAAALLGPAMLRKELDRAIVIEPGELPQRFVMLGSRVKYEDRSTGKIRTIHLVLPEAADIDQSRISVLTPVGAALLGLKVGQEFAWKAQDGRVRTVRILEVEPGREAS